MKKSITTMCCILLCAVCSFAQEFVLHENSVRPSMNEQHKAALLKIKEACVQNKVDMAWNTMVCDDNTFAYVLPVKGTASLDTDLFAELKSKIGEDAFGKMAAEFETSVESRRVGTFIFMPQHSYLDPKPDEKFRSIFFMFPLPGKEIEMENHFLEWRKAFESKKSSENYHIYKATLGNDHAYILSLSAKNPADMEAKRAQSRELIKDVEGALWKKQLTLTRKHYWKRGYFQDGLSYALSAVN